MKAPAFRGRSRRSAGPQERGHVSLADVVRDVGEDLLARPGRTLLTALGTLVGVAVLVATLGLAASLESQISSRFDAIAPRDVTVSPVVEPGRPDSDAVGALPWDGPARVRRIEGVKAAADLSELTPERRVRGSPVHDPTRPAVETMRVMAASPGVFEVIGASLRGTGFDDLHDRRGEAVAVLGRDAADRLGIADTKGRPVVFADGLPVVVIGIIESAERKSTVLSSILIPEGLARARFGLKGPSELVVLTRPGATTAVAAQVPLALRPDDPEKVTASVPPVAQATREAVSSDTRGLLLGLAGVSLVVGGVGIANVTLVAVLQRTTEIGLRRAIGARRRDVLAHFLLSSTVIGAVGAVLGTCVGAWLTVIIANVQGWPATFDRWVVLVGPVVGACTGLLAGAYPSYRAAAIEPIEALRAGS